MFLFPCISSFLLSSINHHIFIILYCKGKYVKTLLFIIFYVNILRFKSHVYYHNHFLTLQKCTQFFLFHKAFFIIKAIILYHLLNFIQYFVKLHIENNNQFCLEIILCCVYSSFDYLIYQYYSAYVS